MTSRTLKLLPNTGFNCLHCRQLLRRSSLHLLSMFLSVPLHHPADSGRDLDSRDLPLRPRRRHHGPADGSPWMLESLPNTTCLKPSLSSVSLSSLSAVLLQPNPRPR